MISFKDLSNAQRATYARNLAATFGIGNKFERLAFDQWAAANQLTDKSLTSEAFVMRRSYVRRAIERWASYTDEPFSFRIHKDNTYYELVPAAQAVKAVKASSYISEQISKHLRKALKGVADEVAAAEAAVGQCAELDVLKKNMAVLEGASVVSRAAILAEITKLTRATDKVIAQARELKG